MRNEPHPDAGTTPPAWLAGEALAEWNRLAPSLEQHGLLSEWDRGPFSAYCTTWARFEHLSRKVADADDLMMEVGDNGYRQAAPELTELRRAQEDLLKLAARFGLTPADRSRLDVQPPAGDEENPWAKLRAGRYDADDFDC